jgi:hypothetical protein
MMDADERQLFADALVGALDGAADIDAALARLGWDEALQDDPRVAVSVLFEWQGRAAASSGALHAVMGAALGRAPAAVVLPMLGSTACPTVRGLALHAPAGLDARRLTGLDPALGLFEVTGPFDLDDGSGKWENAIAAGQRALAHELVGASRAMLDLASTHALERIQFDVPIATFQAVRHRLADSLVAIESAAAAVDAAWDEPGPLTASVAKALAGRSGRLVTKHCQQVLAGIGFTAEHPFHPYLRRVRVLDGLLGDARSLTRELGQSLLQAGELPPILAL